MWFSPVWGAVGTGVGLHGEYFETTNLTGAVQAIRTDGPINFEWRSAGPGGGIENNHFSIRWMGTVEAPATENFTFSTWSDDGVRLWVNNIKVIDNWTQHQATRNTGTPIPLVAGQRYDIKLEYYENTGNSEIKLLWAYPGQKEQGVPQKYLYPAGGAFVSDLGYRAIANGWGPVEKDRSNGEQAAGDGKRLSVGGLHFGKGLGVHAVSDVRLSLDGTYNTFAAWIGIDDEVAGREGSVVFQVWLDSVKALESHTLRGNSSARFISVGLGSAKELRLVVNSSGDGIGHDHADWADAQLVKLAGSTPPGPNVKPGAPTGLTATPGDGQISLKWNEVTGAVSYNVYRGSSAGGESTTPVATGVKTTSFVGTGLTNGTPYFFKVTAINTAGTSPMSNEASATPQSALPPAPVGLTATPGDALISLKWTEVPGTNGYNVYRGTAPGGESATPVATGLKTASFTNIGLTNGTTYYFKVAATNGTGLGALSNEASATPKVPLPLAPGGLTATPGDKLISLKWNEVTGATGYNVFRGTSAGGESSTAVATGLTTTSFTNSGLNNGTTYFFKVAATNASGQGALSSEASATPKTAIPPAPAGLTATPGDSQITLTWSPVTGATSYNVYRGGASGAEAVAPIATGLKTTTFTDINLANGTPFFFTVAALNVAGTGPMSNEATATPQAPGPVLTPAQISAFRFLRQATWGPTQPLIDHLLQVGPAAWIDEQIALPPSDFPDDLITKPNMELVQERFFQNAVTGPDQLRQRMAFALSQIWVVSAVKVDATAAYIPYLRILESGAFGNFFDLMRQLTLSPASGEYLDMINNLKADATKGTAPNENFGRELMQLYTIGLVELNSDGTPKTNPVTGLPIPTYDQATVVEMARALTGWTYADGTANPATRLNPRNYSGPMKSVERFHDTGSKTLFGQILPANQTATQDLDQALTILFNHPNLGPYICRQLIQRLVTSNPSPKYIGDVAAVFNNNGVGVRGDLAAVVKAILTHSEAALGTPTSGKLDEPALFISELVRALNATVADHPFMTDLSEDMGQKVLFSPSVFNYFSPFFRVPGGALIGPEFQLLNTSTAMTRANFVKSLITGGFGTDVTFDLTPFTSLAGTPGAMVDKVNAVIMGGAMSAPMRQAILTAVNAASSARDKVRTAIYLAAISMQYQVEH